MGGVYIIIGDQTLPKGGVSPRKVPPPPPPPIPHIILDQQAVWIGQCSHSVHIGSSLECGHGLLCLQAAGVALATPTGCAGLYQYVRCKQLLPIYSVLVLDRAGIYCSHPLSTLWFALI